MKQRLFHLCLALSVIIADQVTKWFAAFHLRPHHSVEVIPGFFNLTLVRNNGMAFGFMSGETSAYRAIFLSALSLAALALILFYVSRIPLTHRWMHIGLSMIFGGAVGNIIDRVRHQYVIDFLDFYWQKFSWPAFNIADSCISVGMGLLLLGYFFHRSPDSSS